MQWCGTIKNGWQLSRQPLTLNTAAHPVPLPQGEGANTKNGNEVAVLLLPLGQFTLQRILAQIISTFHRWAVNLLQLHPVILQR